MADLIDHLKSAALAIDRVANTMAVQREEAMKMTRACPTPDECTVVLALRAEVESLRVALKQALRQWHMYAEMVEGEERFDVAKEKSPEAEIYRSAYALAYEQKPEDKLYPDTVDRHR